MKKNNFSFKILLYIKMSVPIELKDIVVEWDDKIIRRIRGAKMKGRMDIEFVRILKAFFPNHNDTEWKASYYEDIDEEARSHPKECICSHAIWNICHITHQPTGTTFQVGIHCIRKISESCYQDMLSLRNKYRKQKKEELHRKTHCLSCDNYITTRYFDNSNKCWECDYEQVKQKEREQERLRERIRETYRNCYRSVITELRSIHIRKEIKRLNTCSTCPKDISEAKKKYKHLDVTQCWGCKNPPTGKCLECGKAIGLTYRKCYTCNKK